MNTYEARQEARRQRYLARADKARDEAKAAHDRAHEMASVIPFGQPILVGHHSEKRDRNYRGRIHDTFGRAFAAMEKAKHFEEKAAGVGYGGISSDDPDAIHKLRAKLEGMERSHALMKSVNQAIRRNKTPESRIAALMSLGLTETTAKALLTPDCMGQVGFAAYSLSNSNANMRRIRERITALEKAATRQAKKEDCEGYIYKEDPEENRVMFIFDGKPSQDIRQILKRHAFKWSPSRGAWVRKTTSAALYAAKEVKAALNECGN